MENTTVLYPTSNMNYTDDALLSAPSSPLPMSSNEVKASTLSYCHDNPKANDELIQKATTRLRCRLLQQGLIDAKTKVSHLQGELDNLRIELSTTENVLSKFGEPDDRQLLALERRFNTHQQQLDLLLSSSTSELQPQQPQPKLQESAITASTSFSSTLSRMSSIFSSRQKPFKKTTTPATLSAPFGSDDHPQHSDSSVTNDTCSTTEYDNDLQQTNSNLDARERRMRRRRRVKQLRQEYQQRLRAYDPTWKDDGGNDQRSMALKDDDDNANNKTISDEPTAIPQPSPLSIPPEQQQKLLKKQQQHQHSEQPSAMPNGKEKKRPGGKQASNTMKKPIMTSTKPIQSKPAAAAAPCLCKRKTTNKTHPIKPAPPPHSTTSHSKQPEKELLDTQKHPLSPLSPPPAPPPPAETVAEDETTRTTSPLHSRVLGLNPSTPSLINDDDPPRPSNVSDWLLKQRQYDLEQHQDYQGGDGDDGGNEEAWLKKEILIDNHQQCNATMDIGNNNNDSMMKPMPPLMDNQTKHHHQQQQQHQSTSVFDDVLRYLDNMSDFGNDSGLQQDISHLLAPMYNRAPSTYSSLSSSSSSISSLWSWSTPRSQDHWASLLTNHGMVGKYCSRYLVDGVNKSLLWCKFLSVLSLALLISLGRGPAHMLLSLDDLDYLDLMADQGEPLVYSYYL